jgi:hypothetical protein
MPPTVYGRLLKTPLDGKYPAGFRSGLAHEHLYDVTTALYIDYWMML